MGNAGGRKVLCTGTDGVYSYYQPSKVEGVVNRRKQEQAGAGAVLREGIRIIPDGGCQGIYHKANS